MKRRFSRISAAFALVASFGLWGAVTSPADDALPPTPAVGDIPQFNPKSQDEARPLCEAAEKYFKAGNFVRAVILWHQLLEVPAKPGAHPPGMLPGPVDRRGEAYWGIAEVLRLQEKWSEALENYHIVRRRYPLNDGCVPRGPGLQAMALSEGQCLENLGRYKEAVELYWESAIRLSAGPPKTMNRLVELYSATPKLPTLEAAVRKQEQKERDDILYRFKVPVKLMNDDQKFMYNEQIAGTCIGDFDLSLKIRKAAKRKGWSVLLKPLEKSGKSPIRPEDDFSPLGKDVYLSILDLCTLGDDGMRAVKEAAKSNPDNFLLQATALACTSREQRRASLIQLPPRQQTRVASVLQALDLLDSDARVYLNPVPPVQLPDLPLMN